VTVVETGMEMEQKNKKKKNDHSLFHHSAASRRGKRKEKGALPLRPIRPENQGEHRRVPAG